MGTLAQLWSVLSRAELLAEEGKLSKEDLDALCKQCATEGISDEATTRKIQEFVEERLALGTIA